MYYDDNNVKVKIDWKSLIIKLVLVVFAILLIIWLFPMPKLDTFYNKVYNDNLNTMKEASEKYFTNDKLPDKTGDAVTIKLQDMLDKKLVTNFTDKNNNQCSNTNSYAQVTKTDNSNYVLKVQLSCDEKTDYILENLNITGSNIIGVKRDSSSTDESNSDKENDGKSDGEDDGIEIDASILDSADSKYDKDVQTVEYQYKRAITTTSKSYTCPDGYVRDNDTCYKYETGETIAATPLYFDDVEVKTDAKKNTTGSYTKTAEVIKSVEKAEKVCPDGYTLNGNICYKYTNATITPSTTTYTCPDGYQLNGTKCTKTENATKHTGKDTYYCPDGYTLSGTKCTKTENASKTIVKGDVYYTCDKGGSLNGTKCTYTASYSSGTTSYYCPSGYSDNGSNCVKTVSYTGRYHEGSSAYGNCPSGYSTNGNLCYYSASQLKTWSNPIVQTSSKQLSVYDNGTSKRVLANYACTLKGCTYTYYYYTANISYYCSRGESPVNGYCIIYRPVTKTSSYYTCDDGSKQSSSTCYKKEYTSKKSSTTSGKYSCPNGGSLSGSTCTYSATYHKNNDKTTYTCAPGFTLNGTKCTQTTNATKSTSETTYTCPPGYSLSGTKCIQTIDATKQTTETKYTCPAGYVQEGTTCYQYTEASTKTTYKYDCPEGYNKNGEGEKTTCTKIIESTTTLYCENENEKLVGDQCVKTVKGGLRGYSCPSGYVLNKDQCVKKTLECAPLQEINNTNTTYEYKWSSDSSLEGWTQTGKTREIQNTTTNTNAYEK